MYMAPGTDEAGKSPTSSARFITLRVDRVIVNRKLQRTVIVRTNGAVDDLSPDYPWKETM
jgi:hypothetical protein